MQQRRLRESREGAEEVKPHLTEVKEEIQEGWAGFDGSRPFRFMRLPWRSETSIWDSPRSRNER